MKTLYIVFLLLLFGSLMIAQDQQSTRIYGLVFGDYFYKVTGDSSGAVGQYSANKTADQGFQLRRLYLFADQKLNETFSTQVLLEGTDKSLDPDKRFGVYIKTAFVEWKEILPMSNLQFGLIPTPSWVMISEKMWNYRAVEKTIADYRGLGVATDLGVSLRGKVVGDGLLSYHLMIGNGTGQKPENNKFKKYYASLDYKPAEGLLVEAYADYEPAANTKDKTTLKGFVSYQTSDIRLGAEIVQQLQLSRTLIANARPFGISCFAWAPVPGTTNLKGFARYDYFDNDLSQDAVGVKEHFVTFGLDFTPTANVHVMPNLWINSFFNKNSSIVNRNADVVARMTFFVRF